MKFLVVGSTGLIGSYVAKTLGKHGTVIGVSRTTQIPVDVKDPALIVLRQHGLLRCGYIPVLLDCDSWQVAYMLCSINATYEEESPYKPETRLLCVTSSSRNVFALNSAPKFSDQ